jgi:hypothetical protein
MTTLSWSTTKTSDSYTPALYLEPGKPPRRCGVKCVRLVSAEQARALLAAGKAAWVREGEWEGVESGE